MLCYLYHTLYHIILPSNLLQNMQIQLVSALCGGVLRYLVALLQTLTQPGIPPHNLFSKLYSNNFDRIEATLFTGCGGEEDVKYP